MLEPLTYPAPFRPQPIRSSMDKRAIRFELERQACQSLRQVLQLKLQQRRTREELVNQGIMPLSAPPYAIFHEVAVAIPRGGHPSDPPSQTTLKSSAAFHEQRRNLERARTEDYLKRKIKARPERSELIRMHILEETSAEPSLQAKQLQLKRARLADDLNDKISHRPGPMELIHKNILPVHSSIKQAIIETDFPKGSGENSSFDEDSNDSLSPGQLIGQESPLALGPLPSPSDTLAGSSVPSPTQFLNQVPPPPPPLPPVSCPSPSLKLTNGAVTPAAQRTTTFAQIKSQPKASSDRSAQRPKKPKDNKPKIKKLKYHQYIPPDQKADKEPPPQLDSSYAKILQQQQLFLQLQILNQQQQHYNYHTILPAPPKPQMDQQLSSSATAPSPCKPDPAPLTGSSSHGAPSRQYSTPAGGGAKPISLPPNLDEMKVAELKGELKLRSLPVSGTKNDLIERLRTYQELNGGGGGTSTSAAGGATGPGAGEARGTSKTTTTNNSTSQQQQKHFKLQHQQSDDSGGHVVAGSSSYVTPAAAPPQQLMTFDCMGPSPPGSPAPSSHSPPAMSPEETHCNGEAFREMGSSPLTQLSLHPSSTSHLPGTITIKEEPSYSTFTPCPFSSRFSPLQKHSLVPMAAPAITTTTLRPAAPPIDKDKMLQEKDKQIEELTRMLRQKQRLVEALRLQLQQGKRGGEATEPMVLLRVKEEPPDVPNIPLSPSFSSVHSTPPPPHPCEMDVTKVTIKQEAVEAEETESETSMVKTPDSQGQMHFHSQTQEETQQIQLQIKLEQTSPQTEQQQQQQRQQQQQQLCLQLAQQQAIQQLLLRQQQNIQNQQQSLQNHHQNVQSQILHNQQNLQNHHQSLQKRSQQRKKKSHKQQLKQQQQLLISQQQSKEQQQQQIQLKQQQQILLKQQQMLLQQRIKQQQQQQQQQQQVLLKQQQSKQPQQQINTQMKVQLDQQQMLQAKQQLLIQQSQRENMQVQQQQQSQQVSQVVFNQQSGSTPSFPLDLLKTGSTPSFALDLLKTGSTPTLVTDSNGNHFLITLTNHTTEHQGSDTPQSKVANHITLQRLQSTPAKLPGQSPPQLASNDSQSKHMTQTGPVKQTTRKAQKAGLQLSTNQSQQGVTASFSAPPNLQPFFLDEEITPPRKDALSPSSQMEEVCPGLDHDALFSPLSPASVKTTTSSPDDKENSQHMDDLFDILVQTGEISSSFRPTPDPSLARLHPSSPPSSSSSSSPPPPRLHPNSPPSSSSSSPPPSPLHLVLSPATPPPNPETSKPPTTAQGEPQPPSTTTEEEEEEEQQQQQQQLYNTGSGRLEDFLESTTGKPLLGVEPGGPLMLIDDLHSQMLSTPSILDHPSSPMDTYDLGYTVADTPGGLGFGEQPLDNMDWLDLTMGGGVSEETPALAPQGTPTPLSVFSVDFLDSPDLQIHWDSCL